MPVVFSFDLVLLSGAIILDLACSERFGAEKCNCISGVLVQLNFLTFWSMRGLLAFYACCNCVFVVTELIVSVVSGTSVQLGCSPENS